MENEHHSTYLRDNENIELGGVARAIVQTSPNCVAATALAGKQM